MATVILNSTQIANVKQGIIADFRDYVDTCIKSGATIKLRNRLGDSKSSNPLKHQALLQWGDGKTYQTDNACDADIFTSELIFPILEIAINAQRQDKRTYHSSINSQEIDRVSITATSNSSCNTQKTGTTKYFS